MEITLLAYGESLRRQGYRPETIRQRMVLLEQLRDPFDPTADELLDVIATPRRQSSRITYMKTLRACWRDWTTYGWVDRPWPLQGYRMPAAPPPEPRPYSDLDLNLMLRLMREPLRAWTVLGAYAGLRVGEVQRLQAGDFDGRRLWVDGKGGKRASVPAHHLVVAVMETWRGAGYARVTSMSRIWGEEAKRVGVPGARFHRLRTTFACRLLEAGVDLVTVSSMLRHTSLKSTQHYVRTTDPRLANAVAVLS